MSMVRLTSRVSIAMSFVLALIGASVADAQEVLPRRAGPATISGVVTDTLGQPLANITVLVGRLRRATRTRADGSFRFDSIAPGAYDISARGIGFISPTSNVAVGREGATVVIRMIRVSTALPSMVTTASRRGLSGVIGDTTFRAIPEVRVTVMGTGTTIRTDSAGAFFAPLKPGTYMLRLERDGFARQIVSVTIPDEEGRRIAAWLVPENGPGNLPESHALFEMNQRLIRNAGVGTRFFSREALERLGDSNAEALIRRYATGPITECRVSVNGGPVLVPLWSFTAAELEFVEIYLPGATPREPVTSILSNPTKFTTNITMRPLPKPECGNLGLVIWLRK